MTYTEKTHAAYAGQTIDTADAKTLAWLIRRNGLEMTHLRRHFFPGGDHGDPLYRCAERESC